MSALRGGYLNERSAHPALAHRKRPSASAGEIRVATQASPLPGRTGRLLSASTPRVRRLRRGMAAPVRDAALDRLARPTCAPLWRGAECRGRARSPPRSVVADVPGTGRPAATLRPRPGHGDRASRRLWSVDRTPHHDRRGASSWARAVGESPRPAAARSLLSRARRRDRGRGRIARSPLRKALGRGPLPAGLPQITSGSSSGDPPRLSVHAAAARAVVGLPRENRFRDRPPRRSSPPAPDRRRGCG